MYINGVNILNTYAHVGSKKLEKKYEAYRERPQQQRKKRINENAAKAADKF